MTDGVSSAVELDLPTGSGSRGTLICYSSFESYELADYLAAHPSSHPSVRHAGRHFAAYLAVSRAAGTPPALAE